MNHRQIGSEHLFMGLFREEGCLAAQVLKPFGVSLDQLRKKSERATEEVPRYRRPSPPTRSTVQIHNSYFDLDSIRDAVDQCRDRNWHWRKVSCKPRECVVERKTGKVSLELSLAEDAATFEPIKGGWKKDHCSVCGRELFESENDHGTGYTNGRDWLCTGYDKFWDRPNFISGSYSDIT
ncbi:MAG TPA: Clp protease N-terminal domain-containing protein [Candidatus Sulfotelmatobacter sp.]|nr:Clp protease N-terminal domain-containing protein [Candidatus Sulfotelmatobacter sp.]